MPFVFIPMNRLYFPGLIRKKKKKERKVHEQFFVSFKQRYLVQKSSRLALAISQVSIKVNKVKFINLFFQFIEEKFINEFNSFWGKV